MYNLRVALAVLSILPSIAFSEEPVPIVINEVNSQGVRKEGVSCLDLHKTKCIETEEYLELFSFVPNYSLTPFKVVGISLGNLLTVEFVADLTDERTDENGFYVIGGTNVDVAQLRVPDQRVAFREKFIHQRNKGQLSLVNMLQNGNRVAKAILLVYNRGEISEIEYTEENSVVTVSSTLFKAFKENMIDIVVYAHKANIERCNVLEKLAPKLKDQQYMSREYDSDDKEFSINRCSVEKTGINPEQLKIGKRTPKAENDCTGTFFTLQSEDSDLCELTQPNPPFNEDENIVEKDTTEPNESQCHSPMGTEYHLRVSAYKVRSRIDDNLIESQADETCRNSFAGPSSGNRLNDVSRGNNRKRHLSPDGDFSEKLPWENKDSFK